MEGQEDAHQVFKGKAKKLSQDSENVTSEEEEEERAESEPAKRTLTFWKDGFSLNEEGPLYAYDDAENQRILAMLQSGQAPLQLLKVRPGQAVDLQLAHRMNEPFQPLTRPCLPFVGKGRRLGEMTEFDKPNDTDHGIKGEEKDNAEQKNVLFDPNRPTTTLQLRMANGSKKSLTFNTDSSIASLYLKIAELDTDGREFKLLTGRPPVVLEHNDQRTLQEASLINSVIIQQHQ